MSTVQEIEEAISRLGASEYSRVRDWLLEFDNKRWDEQMAADAAAGRLDWLLREVESDIAQGRVKPLAARQA